MSDLPIVAWAEYARESLIGVSMQYDEGSPFLLRPLADHAAATASLASAQQRIEELERALGELVALEDLKKSLAAANHHASRFPTDENYAVIDQLSTDIARRRRPAWHAARALVARGIVSPEGIETQRGSTAQQPEPGPAGARPSEAYLSGISPQSAWPFAQDDKGTK